MYPKIELNLIKLSIILIIIYFRSLRTANSWSENRDVFNEEASRIRAEFNQNKSLDTGKNKLLMISSSIQMSCH